MKRDDDAATEVAFGGLSPDEIRISGDPPPPILTMRQREAYEDLIYGNLYVAHQCALRMDRLKAFGPDYWHEDRQRKNAIASAHSLYNRLLRAGAEIMSPLLVEMILAEGLTP